MRFLIINDDYASFLVELYREHPALQRRSFQDQLQVRDAARFGTSDFYPRHLRALGHEAHEIHINNMWMQLAWAREHGRPLWHIWPWPFQTRHRLVPGQPRWFRTALRRQVAHYRPDVVLTHSSTLVAPAIWREVRSKTRLLVLQHAAMPLDPSYPWDMFHLVVSSFPPTLEWVAAKGIKAELFRLGFDPGVLADLTDGPRSIPVSFVGSFLPVHSTRTAWLEEVCRHVDVQVWSSDAHLLPSHSPIRTCLQGAAWGRKMYQVLRDSRITLNHHGNVPAFANNMRLYEATGVGTLLITDWKENLHEMFEPGKEVVAYRDADECVAQIKHYLTHEDERARIAAAGQTRTLTTHTYAQRMHALVEIVARHLA